MLVEKNSIWNYVTIQLPLLILYRIPLPIIIFCLLVRILQNTVRDSIACPPLIRGSTCIPLLHVTCNFVMTEIKMVKCIIIFVLLLNN